MKIITYDEFDQVDLRSGRTVKVEDFPRAKKPAYKVWADFGEDIGVLQTSAQVTVHYSKDALMGKLIVGCVNLEEKNIAGFKSQFLLVGFADPAGAVCLLSVDPAVHVGQKLF